MTMLAPVLNTAPAADVLDRDTEVKQHLRIDHTDEDDLLDVYIAAATKLVDGYTGILGRALVNQTWKQNFAGWSDCMRLRVGPVSSITSVKYYDEDNTQQTLSASVYTYLTDALGAYVRRAPDQSWPGHYSRLDAIEVLWVAGYGAAGSAVPAGVRTAMLLAIGNWYDNRDGAMELPPASLALLRPYRQRVV